MDKKGNVLTRPELETRIHARKTSTPMQCPERQYAVCTVHNYLISHASCHP